MSRLTEAAVLESREVFVPRQFLSQSNRAILAGSEAGSSHYRDKFSYIMAPVALIIAFEQRRAAIVSYCDACIVRHGCSNMALTTCSTNVYVDVCVSCWHGDELGSRVDLNDNANFSVLCPALINVYTSLYVDVCWYGGELGSQVDVNNFSALCPVVINVYMYGNHAIRCIICSSLYVDVCVNCVSCYHDGELWSHGVCSNAFTNDLCACTCPACLPDVCPVFICEKSYCIIVFSCIYTCVQYMYLLLLCCGDVELNPGPSARQKREKQRKYYVEHKNEILSKRKDTYKKSADKTKAARRAYYSSQSENERAYSRAYSQAQYAKDPEAKKASSRLYAKKKYAANPEPKKASSREYSKKRYSMAKKLISRARYRKNPHRKLMMVKRYDATHRRERLSYFKNRYALTEPTHCMQEVHKKTISSKILNNSKVLHKLVSSFREKHVNALKKRRNVLNKLVCKMTSNRLVYRALALRKQHAGELLKVVRAINKSTIKNKTDFGEGCHSASYEHYFYDATYLHLPLHSVIPVRQDGRCVVSEFVRVTNSPKEPLKWKCSSNCRPLTDCEVASILEFRKMFESPMKVLRTMLHKCDDCPYEHFSKYIASNSQYSAIERKGHPLVCFLDNSECCSQLRILRAASTHYPVLRKFLHYIYTAITHHMYVYNIDLALRTGDYALLLQLTEIDSLETLLLDVMAIPDASTTTTTTTTLRRPGLESQLQIDNAELINMYNKEIHDFAELVCCSCERLHHRKNVSKVKFTDKLGTKVWPRLKAYLLEQDPAAASEVFYMCNYCKPSLKKNTMPPRCVLNGLHVIPIPPELDRLDLLSSQLIQRAKCYQTVVRLGTYTGRVPSHNALKACKGNMFFLPLPLDKTLETHRKKL